MNTGESLLMMVGVLALTAAGAFGQTPVVLRDEAFEVTLPPGFPAAKPTKTGDALGVDYSSQGPNGIARVQYADFAEEAVDADKAFQSIRDNVIQGMRIDSEEEYTLQGHRGLRLYFTATTLNQALRMDCLLVGRRLYRTWYIARTAAELRTPAVRAFFDSFRLR